MKEYTINNNPESRKEKLKASLIKHMNEHKLVTADASKQIGVSSVTLDKYLKDYYVSEKTLDKVDQFLQLKAENTPVTLKANEYRFVSTLDLSNDFKRATAIGYLLSVTKEYSRGPVTDLLLNGEDTRENVVGRLFKAISTGNWEVSEEKVYYVQLPSGHYATERTNEFGDIRVEWEDRKTLNTITYTSYEDALRAFPEFKEYIKEERVNGDYTSEHLLL